MGRHQWSTDPAIFVRLLEIFLLLPRRGRYGHRSFSLALPEATAVGLRFVALRLFNIVL